KDSLALSAPFVRRGRASESPSRHDCRARNPKLRQVALARAPRPGKSLDRSPYPASGPREDASTNPERANHRTPASAAARTLVVPGPYQDPIECTLPVL